MQQSMRKKLQKGNGKQLGMANYDIYFENEFNRLVMNITQTNVFTDNMLIYAA